MSTVSTSTAAPRVIPGPTGRTGATALASLTGRGEDTSAAGEFAMLLGLLVPQPEAQPDPDAAEGAGHPVVDEAAALAGTVAAVGATPPGTVVDGEAPAVTGDTAVRALLGGAARTGAAADALPAPVATPAGPGSAPTGTPVPAQPVAANPAPAVTPAAASGVAAEVTPTTSAAPTTEVTPGPAGLVGTAGAAGAASVPVEGAATAEQRAAVLEQVGRVLEAQVGRAVQRGDGTQRLTLTLYPATLGEVQVTLTVRGGEVQVHLAASGSAQAALADDGEALHRLLERAGAGTARLTVGELGTSAPVRVDAPAVTTAPQAASASADPADQQPGAQHGEQADSQDRDARDAASTDRHTDHQHAGTRGGDAPAMDGSREGTGTAGPPHDAGTRTRPGVDVTI